MQAENIALNTQKVKWLAAEVIKRKRRINDVRLKEVCSDSHHLIHII